MYKPKRTLTEAQVIGRNGERQARLWLEDNGFVIRDTNWRSAQYEIDIVARKGNMLHIVEVKCRRAGSLTTPEEAITYHKADVLLRGANLYVEQHDWQGEIQIDLIAVDAFPDGDMQVRYIPNAVVPH